MIDRLPPQSTEAEQSVLGSILIDRDAIVEIAEFLRPEDFYRPANGSVYAAMLELFDKREPVDIVTVAEALERTDQLETVGGRSYLSSLSNQTPTAVHAVQYARIVERKAVLRNLISAAGKIAGIGYEDPAEIQEAIDRAESELFNVSQRRVSTGFSPLKTLLHDAYDRLDYLHAHRGEISGVRTGFADLDALTTGLQKSDLIVLAARPSVGKTSFALNIAEYAAVNEGRSVGVFSLEMSKEQLVLRLLSSVANIDSQRLRTGFLEEMDFARLAPAMNALSEAPVYIDDTPNITAMELRTKARRLQAEAGLDLIVVDYLQLMQATTSNRDANRVQEVSEISRGLKALARELSVPVIALSQSVTAAGDAGKQGTAPVGSSGVRGHRAGRRPGHVPVARQGARRRRCRSGGGGHQPQAREAPQRAHWRDPALLQEAPDPVRGVRGRALRGRRRIGRPTRLPYRIGGSAEGDGQDRSSGSNGRSASW